MLLTRRVMLALLGLLCTVAALAQAAPAGRITLEQLREMRRQAAHRPRRMIFNNDGDDVIYYRKELTPEALLALRTTPLVGSHVDSIFYSNSMCFGQALHNSKVFTPFVSREDTFKDNPMPDYLTLGLDPIQVMADFGHRHGLEVFWDMRMNDTHDVGLTGYGPLLLPQLKKDHPEYLVGSPDRQPPHGTWSSVNYAVPEVRDLAYRFFEEVCQKFDVDGLEFDFFRHACFFQSVAWGGEATRAERDMMTDLLRRTRAMTEREGLRRGRPILIAIRVPDSVGYCRAIGLDVESWLREGLVDLLVGTCYFQLHPWEYLVGLGHRYRVPVYPSLSESRVQGETRFSRHSLESYRARAARAWAAGADGIYIFNYFDPRGPIWRELGDPQALRNKDKLYFVTVRDGSPDSYLKDGGRFRHVPVLTPVYPRQIKDQPTVFELLLAEDLAQNPPPKVTCHLRLLSPAPVKLAVNDHPVTQVATQGQWLDFAVPVKALRRGANRLAITAAPAPAAADDWTVTYLGDKLPGEPWTKDGGYAEGCVTEVQDGKLLIADRGTADGSYAYYRYTAFIDPARETVIEARLKLLSGWSSILVENGVAAEEIDFHPHQVRARYLGLSAPVRTDDDFHTYRLTLRGEDLRVYMDGKLIIDATGKFLAEGSHGYSAIMFGAANSNGMGEALWEMVRVRNPALTLLDAAMSFDYP